MINNKDNLGFEKQANLNLKTDTFQGKLTHEKYLLSGPTYANAEPHPGTLFNLSVKDSICRFSRANGFGLYMIGGIDVHGEPILRALIKEKYLNKPLPNNQILVEECRSFAKKNANLLFDYCERLGINFQIKYSTNDKDYMLFQLNRFFSLWKQKKFVFDFRHLIACVECKTFLSFSETENILGDKYSCFFKVKLLNSELKILIWTTTPYSVWSNQGVAFNPEIKYVICEINVEKIIVSEFFALNNNFLIIESFVLENLKYIHPLNSGKINSFIASEKALLHVGTGFIHLSADYSATDASILKTQFIYAKNNIINNEFLLFTSFGYKTLFEANQLSVNNLDIYTVEISKQNVDVCWRCKNTTISFITRQLFLDFEPSKKAILSDMKHARFFPKHNQRMMKMFKNRPSWCVTRQKPWGIYWPIVKCVSCEKIMIIENVFREYLQKFENESSWFDLQVNEQCIYCKSEVKKEYFTMDVWLDSAMVWPFFSKEKNKESFLSVEGEDQYKCWWQVSYILSNFVNSKSITKILVHPFIVADDKTQEKLSKSAGNYLSMNSALEKFPNDIVRLCFFSSNMVNNFMFSEQSLSLAKDNYIIIRTHLRFLFEHSSDINDLNELTDLQIEYLSFVKTSFKATYIEFKKTFNLNYVLKKILELISINNTVIIELFKNCLFQTEDHSSKKMLRIVLVLLLNQLDAMIPFTVFDCMENESLEFEKIFTLSEKIFKNNILKIDYLIFARSNFRITSKGITISNYSGKIDVYSLHKEINDMFFKLKQELNLNVVLEIDE